MKKMHTKIVLMLTVIAMLLSFTSCEWIDSLFGKNEISDWRPNSIETNVSSDSLYVKKVENLSDDFIMGMDASCVPALEASGVKYFDHDGNEKDVYEILSMNGIN